MPGFMFPLDIIWSTAQQYSLPWSVNSFNMNYFLLSPILATYGTSSHVWLFLSVTHDMYFKLLNRWIHSVIYSIVCHEIRWSGSQTDVSIHHLLIFHLKTRLFSCKFQNLLASLFQTFINKASIIHFISTDDIFSFLKFLYAHIKHIKLIL
jgi:hypothetical protein